MSESWSLLLDLVSILAAAFLFGAVLERFRQSAVLGYILAGIVLGPGAFAVIRSAHTVEQISEIGVALLLFTIGLEFSWHRLRRLGGVALGGGALQLILTISLGTLLGLLMHFEWKASLTMGAILALSSTAVVLRVLKERTELDSAHGKNALGVLLFQDVALIPLMLLVTFFAKAESQTLTVVGVSSTLVKVIIAVIVFLLVIGKFMPRALRSRAMIRNRELPILLAVVACLGSAWGAREIGISPSIGAFLAGMLLAETPYAEQIRADVGALKTLFVTLFFASVGMLADIHWIGPNIGSVLIIAFAMIVGKTAMAYVAIRLFKQTIITSLATAIALAQVGEFSFVLMQIATKQKLFDSNIENLVSSSAVISLIAGAFLVASAPKIARFLSRRFVIRRKLIDDLKHEAHPKMRNHVVLVGYGESGQAAAQPLSEAGYDLFVLDVDPKLIKKAKSKGIHARIGDASLWEILDGAHIDTARAVVITIPDHRTSRIVINHVKKRGPGVFIAARARYRSYVDELLKVGADCVVDESLLTGTRLGEGVLKQTKDPDDPAGPERI